MREILGGVEGGETVLRINYVKKKIFFLLAITKKSDLNYQKINKKYLKYDYVFRNNKSKKCISKLLLH